MSDGKIDGAYGALRPAKSAKVNITASSEITVTNNAGDAFDIVIGGSCQLTAGSTDKSDTPTITANYKGTASGEGGGGILGNCSNNTNWNDTNITIDNGTITGTSGNSLGIYHPQVGGKLTISGGTLTSTNDTNILNTDKRVTVGITSKATLSGVLSTGTNATTEWGEKRPFDNAFASLVVKSGESSVYNYYLDGAIIGTSADDTISGIDKVTQEVADFGEVVSGSVSYQNWTTSGATLSNSKITYAEEIDKKKMFKLGGLLTGITGLSATNIDVTNSENTYTFNIKDGTILDGLAQDSSLTLTAAGSLSGKFAIDILLTKYGTTSTAIAATISGLTSGLRLADIAVTGETVTLNKVDVPDIANGTTTVKLTDTTGDDVNCKLEFGTDFNTVSGG